LKLFLKPQTVTALIFLLLLLLRLPGLDNSPAEYHAWRQSDTEAIARNFTEQKFNIFYPQLNYDGPLPNYAQLEFQITTFLIACLYRLFGYHYFLARLIPLLFFAGSAYGLFCIGRELGGQLYGWLALSVYGSFPFCVYFSRAIMPEAAALFFMTAGLYAFIRWQRAKSNLVWLFLAAGSTALAISQKVPAIYIGIPMVYLLWQERGVRILKNSYIWAWAILALGPPLLYFWWLQGVAETDYVSGIAANLLFPGWFKQKWLLEAGPFMGQGLLRAYTPLGLGLALGGFLLLDCKRDRLLSSWAVAAAIEVVGVAAIIRLDYYLLLAAPIMALLAAAALRQVWQSSYGRMAIYGLVLSMVLLGWQEAGLRYQQDQEILQKALAVEEATQGEDLLVLGTYNPQLLNLSHRYGWRANIFYPQDPQTELDFFIVNQAVYFIAVDGQVEGDYNGSYYRYLQEHYQEKTLQPGLSLFILNK